MHLKEKRNKAWDERFDHIASHFEKEKRGIEEWVCVEENRRKGVVGREMDKWVFDVEDERGETREGEDDGRRGAPPEIRVEERGASTESVVRGGKRVRAEELGDGHGHASKRQKKTYVKTTYCVSHILSHMSG